MYIYLLSSISIKSHCVCVSWSYSLRKFAEHLADLWVNAVCQDS